MFTLPDRAGLGLKPNYFEALLHCPDPPWVEIHSENYFCDGGPLLDALATLREKTPISLHGIGMSLGSADGLDKNHLQQLECLIQRIRPAAVSEHLAWNRIDGKFTPDLFPVPYTEEALQTVCTNLSQAQDTLGRAVAVENPSRYLTFADDRISETDFLQQLCKSTDCALLLDVNNVIVSAQNCGFDPVAYIDSFPLDRVVEIHLAGHAIHSDDSEDPVFIDDHGSAVGDACWKLYEHTLQKAGRNIPTLVEWDSNIPPFDVLLQQVETANRILATR